MKCALILSLALAVMASCNKPVSTVNISSSGQYNWIRTDSELSQTAKVVGVNKAREDDLLRVQVQIQNQGSTARDIIYRYIWLDDKGMEIQTPLTTWQRIRVQGYQAVSLNGVAPDARVADCRLEMKRPDR